MTLRISRQLTSHPDSREMLARYFAEIRARFHFDAKGQAVVEEMDPPGGVFLVGYDDDKPVAGGGFRTWEPGTCEIKRMYVSASTRGKGYGHELLDALEREAKEAGFNRIVLDTLGSHLDANTLYDGSGYKRIEAYNENPYATAWFVKEL